MEQPEHYQLTQMVNHTMVFIARCFLIPATLQFVVITRYYASFRLAGKKSTHSKSHSTEVFRMKHCKRLTRERKHQISGLKKMGFDLFRTKLVKG
jgi:hypothetical protein